MSTSEVDRLLREEGYRADHDYVINGGLGYELVFVIAPIPAGQWEAFLAERGTRGARHVFSTESEACEHLLSIVRKHCTPEP